MSGSKFSKKNREKAGNVLFNMPIHEQKEKIQNEITILIDIKVIFFLHY